MDLIIRNNICPRTLLTIVRSIYGAIMKTTKILIVFPPPSVLSLLPLNRETRIARKITSFATLKSKHFNRARAAFTSNERNFIFVREFTEDVEVIPNTFSTNKIITGRWDIRKPFKPDIFPCVQLTVTNLNSKFRNTTSFSFSFFFFNKNRCTTNFGKNLWNPSKRIECVKKIPFRYST